MEKRLELRQRLKSKLLTLSPSRQMFHSSQHFIPNSRDTDFLERHGLDCVMTYLTSESPEFNEHNPHVCSICQIDSTQNWWCSSMDEQQAIFLCDQCEQTRMRRWIVQQHRESMKSAFLQAKESERRLEVDYEKQSKGVQRARRTPTTNKTSRASL